MLSFILPPKRGQQRVDSTHMRVTDSVACVRHRQAALVCCVRVCEQGGHCGTGQKAEWMHGSSRCICILLCQDVSSPDF